MTDDKKRDSYLHEAQLEGRAQGEVKLNLEEALGAMHCILSDQELKAFANKKDEDWDPVRLAIYCHDCHAIVPPAMGKGYKGKMRTVCGACKSKKISSGREAALKQFYGLEREEA